MTESLMVTEINCTTGEVIERPFTAEEIAQREADLAVAQADHAAYLASVEAKATAKASAEAKLAALGLTAEEIAAL